MRVLGLIVEYNPFHNGHLYHIQQSKKICNADYVVCVMSGNFIQRGEPAMVNKWARAKMALSAGADLVIELPVVYAMSSAEFFAYGAVSILDSLGIVDYLCFGSESGCVQELDFIAETLFQEPDAYRTLLKENLSLGLSYPSSRERALEIYLKHNTGFSHNIEALVGSSNNILGIEYLKALIKLKSKITPFTIKRVNNSYNAGQLTGDISSATAIRKLIFSNSLPESYDKLEKVMPEACLSILKEEFEKGRGPVSSSDFDNIILSSIRKMTQKQLKSLPYVTEGLENRIKNAAGNSGTLDEAIEKISTKRYTRTRIQRSLFSILTGLTALEFDTFNNFGGPQYIRVLGFNSNGRQLLVLANKNSTLPVVVKTADFKNTCNHLFKRMLEVEALATDMYVLGYKNTDYKKAGQDFTQKIIRCGL